MTPERTTETPTPYVADAAALGDLEDWGELEEAVGEPMHASGKILWQEGDEEVGIWECTPGLSRWSLEHHEFVQVLSGRMRVTPDGGEPLELRPGSTALFPRGWRGTWEIHETLRKAYAIFG